MDWNTIISLFGIVGTWVTIGLVYFTLREMRNQRIASQKPHLILPKSKVYGYSYPKTSSEDPMDIYKSTLWSDKEINTVIPESRDFPTLAAVKLYNIGFGVANNIILKWNVDYDKTIEQIKDYCYKNSVPIILDVIDDSLSYSNLRIVSNLNDRQNRGLYTTHSPIEYHHDFLMPITITSEGLASSVPPTIIELISIAVYLMGHRSRERRQDANSFSEFFEEMFSEEGRIKIDFPSMYLEVHYDDLEGNHYSQKFEVLFSELSYVLKLTILDEKEPIRLLSGAFDFKSLKL